METLYRVPFLVLECPNLKLKKPPWVHMPSAMTVYALVVVSYFLITGGNSGWRGSRGAEPGSSLAREAPLPLTLSPGASIALLSIFSEDGEKIWGAEYKQPKGLLSRTPGPFLGSTRVLTPIAFFLLAS